MPARSMRAGSAQNPDRPKAARVHSEPAPHQASSSRASERKTSPSPAAAFRLPSAAIRSHPRASRWSIPSQHSPEPDSSRTTAARKLRHTVRMFQPTRKLPPLSKRDSIFSETTLSILAENCDVRRQGNAGCKKPQSAAETPIQAFFFSMVPKRSGFKPKRIQ